MSRSQSAAANLPCPDKDCAAPSNVNNDKVRINFLKETLDKMLKDPHIAKKAANIIEEMIHSGPKKV